jgi:hypothetical protein
MASQGVVCCGQAPAMSRGETPNRKERLILLKPLS